MKLTIAYLFLGLVMANPVPNTLNAREVEGVEDDNAMMPSITTNFVGPAEGPANRTHHPWHHKGTHDHGHEHGQHRGNGGPYHHPPPPHWPPPHSPPRGHGPPTHSPPPHSPSHGHCPPPHWRGHHGPRVQSKLHIWDEEDPMFYDRFGAWDVEEEPETQWNEGEEGLWEWDDEVEQ
ncbi:hypothetical protein N0V82_010317 [Gnomoniopsis sp. IMI 355080]|nr:hypothetical protein N0V82_010317 [Gnomoniopsis sp. IMI 355080]